MIGVGILGFAHGHVRTYCREWQRWPGRVAIRAAWDHCGERLQEAVAAHGGVAMPSVEALLARSDIGAAVIGAETSMHADLVVRAAEAGKTIVLQKPLALTLEDAERMEAAVQAAGVPFTLAWQMRVDPQNLFAKDLIESGELGQVFMVRRRHGLSTHLWPDFDTSWHVQPELNRGMWADDACHALDFLRWLLGEPEWVFAHIDTLFDPKVPDDHGLAVLGYNNGTIAEVNCSFVCAAGENTMEITAEKGVLIQNYGDGPSCAAPRAENAPGLRWYKTEDKQWIHSQIPSPAAHSERIAALAEPLLEFMEGSRPAIASVGDGRTSLALTLACYESSATKRRVDFSSASE